MAGVGDIGLFDLGGSAIDLRVEQNDLLLDDGLKTAVLISLFTDRRADPDELQGGDAWRRGWWADELADEVNDQHGSKLWLLTREKQTQSVAERAREYCVEALQWLIDDGIAATVKVSTSFPSRGILGIEIEIARPSGQRTDLRFDYVWQALAEG